MAKVSGNSIVHPKKQVYVQVEMQLRPPRRTPMGVVYRRLHAWQNRKNLCRVCENQLQLKLELKLKLKQKYKHQLQLKLKLKQKLKYQFQLQLKLKLKPKLKLEFIRKVSTNR